MGNNFGSIKQRKALMSTYTEKFYDRIKGDSLSSAREILPLVMKFINPQSVIDVGCGVGSFLSVFKENGVNDIFGVDGDWVDRKLLEIPVEKFLAVNLEKPIPVDRQFDLVVSVEVAEHLPKKHADAFVESLTNLGKVCLFSAAIPRQPGANHVNTQWPEYWIERFQNRGYVVIDCIRNKAWNNPQVVWWYKQNIFLFVKQAYLPNYPLLQNEFEKNSLQFSIVHPEFYRAMHINKNALDANKFELKNAPRFPYSEKFYQHIKPVSRSSAEIIVPLLLKLVNPKSVIDVGCGTGSWLSVFADGGVKDILGVDGDWVKKFLEIPLDNFRVADLEKSWKVDRQFDLALSLAVAEHLPIDCAEAFVASLTDLAPACLFCAAIPGQGGLNHLNEQWSDYWVKLFSNRGYVAIDYIKKRVWNNKKVAWWYSQSIMLFVRQDKLSNYPLLKIELEKNNNSQLSVVHPLVYIAKSKK